ncbi:hypothetical protein WMY93_022174 [Mugilogobius chulae]|uniref:Uncharacterized protein n=1 Tax=Mugilogobius chulae TaxID=88201 RepID=A0AAW0NHE6_9GOBI
MDRRRRRRKRTRSTTSVSRQSKSSNDWRLSDRSLLRRRKMMQEREEEEREAQRKQEEGSQYQDLVEKEIQKAVADQRIVFPLQAHKDKNEPTRLTFYQKGKNDVVLQKGKFEAREKKNLEQKHTDFKDKVQSNEGLYVHSSLSCNPVQKYHSTSESQQIKEKVEREHISLSHQVTNDFSMRCHWKHLRDADSAGTTGPLQHVLLPHQSQAVSPKAAVSKSIRITDLPMKPTAQTNRVVFTNTPTVIQEEKKCRFPATAPKVIPKLIILDENSQQAATGKCEGVKLPSIRPPRQQAQNCDMPTPPSVTHNVRFLKTPTYSTPPPIAPMFTKKVPFNDPSGALNVIPVTLCERQKVANTQGRRYHQ